MNWYERHLGDWAKKTGHLSMLEEGAYTRMVDWCYIHERPLPMTEREVCKVARASTPTERAAVRRILHEYFQLADDGWHQGRIDKVLRAYEKSVSHNVNNPDSPAERAARYRARRSELFKRLQAVGANPAFDTPNPALESLLREHGQELPPGNTSRANVTHTSRDVAGFVVASQPPTTINTSVTPAAVTQHAVTLARDGAAAAGAVDPTLTGRAIRQLKAAGFSSFNAADPRFVSLVQQGVSDDEWRLTAAEAVTRDKGWGWLLATIAGRRADVIAGIAPPRGARAPGSRDPDRVAGLTPTIAAKRLGSA